MRSIIYQLTGVHILLVDDDPDILTLFTYVLQQAGVVLTVVQDGISAREALQKATYDLLLTDYQLPGMCGDALCRHAHKYGTRRTVLMSCSPQLRQLAHDCRADGTYQKGQPLHELLGLLTNLVVA